MVWADGVEGGTPEEEEGTPGVLRASVGAEIVDTPEGWAGGEGGQTDTVAGAEDAPLHLGAGFPWVGRSKEVTTVPKGGGLRGPGKGEPSQG